jgi:hypothetical protein
MFAMEMDGDFQFFGNGQWHYDEAGFAKAWRVSIFLLA